MKDEKYSALDEWVRMAGEGDQTAREMLLMSFKPLIYKQAAKYRHHHDSLEDAVQYGGVILLEAAADYRAGSSQPFPAFLSARLRYRFADAGRRAARSGRMETRPLLPGDEAIADPDPTPEECLLDKASDRSARLRAMVDALPPERAEVLRLHYYGGKSLKAISGIQGVAPATVKTRLHRGLQALRRQRDALE